MNVERLGKLANFLRKVPDENFNLKSWRSSIDPYEEGIDDQTATDEDLLGHVCGTTGCAVGWACALPEFNKQGLIWDDYGPLFESNDLVEEWDDATPTYIGWDAVDKFFDITLYQSNYLFSDIRYDDNATPTMVADRIDNFIKDGYEIEIAKTND